MQTPIGEGLGASDALAPVAALSVDEGAPLTPAAVRGAGISRRRAARLLPVPRATSVRAHAAGCSGPES